MTQPQAGNLGFRAKSCFLALKEKQKYPRHSTGSLSKYHELHSSNVCLRPKKITQSSKKAAQFPSACHCFLTHTARVQPKPCSTNTRVFVGTAGLLSTQKYTVNAAMRLTEICEEPFYFLRQNSEGEQTELGNYLMENNHQL